MRGAVTGGGGDRDAEFDVLFRYDKSVDNGGLAQMERLLQFGRVLSRCM